MITAPIDYPRSLPCPLREGYELRHVQPFVRTQMASGRARQRRRFAAVPTMTSVTWLMHSAAEAAAFEAWFRDSLDDGELWFSMPLRTPAGERDYVCRFVQMYDGPQLAGVDGWRFTAPLELYERPIAP